MTQDYGEAVRWYRKAADKGWANAQNNLGGMYLNGQGVTQDDVQAHMRFNLSTEQGDETARKYRDIVAKKMTADQIAEVQRLAREWKPKWK